MISYNKQQRLTFSEMCMRGIRIIENVSTEVAE
jgi:hypothetical protein